MKCESLVKLLTITLLVSLFYSCKDEQNSLLDYGVSKELAEQRKNNIRDVVYKLHFHIPEAKSDPINGKLELLLSLESSQQDLILDFDQPQESISLLNVNGTDVDVNMTSNHLVLNKSDLKEGKNSIIVDFVAGDQSLNRQDDYLYTLFVPARASTCFPLFDQPDIKAVFDLSLIVPEKWKALANGAEENVMEENGKLTYNFQPSEKISSYLFAFTAGEYDKISRTVNGRKMTMLHRETDSVKLGRNLDKVFELHAQSLDWLEDYTGIPQPFQKFDFALIPAFQYGGMEHPGAVFYKASSLLLDENPTVSEKLGRASLIAHESAHMWFGNLVTMRWFDDVWLKEVFANFMAAKIINPRFPEIDHDLQFLLKHYPEAYSVDRSDGSHPIAQKLDNLYQAGSLYGNIIYDKAPIAMRMLEGKVGEEAFKDAMRDYLQNHEMSNASWDDLIDIMNNHTKADLNEWNDSWIKRGGMPIIISHIKEKRNKYRGIKVQTVNDHHTMWSQNLKVALLTDSVFYEREVVLSEREGFIDADSMQKPQYIFSNYGGTGYGYFRFGSDSKQYFLENVGSLKEAISRAAVWLNLYEETVRGHIEPERYVDAVLKNLPREKEPLIVEYLLETAVTNFWKFLSPEQREPLSSKLEGLLFNMAISSQDGSVRSAAFEAFGKIVNTPQGVELLKNIWARKMEMNQLPFSEDDYTNMAYELAIRLPSEADSLLKLQGSRIYNPDRKRKFEFVSRALNGEQRMRDDFFESLKEPINRQNEAWVLDALKYLHHPLRSDVSVKYIRPSLELLEEVVATGDIFFPKRWLDMTFSGHRGNKAADAIRQFLYKHHDYDLKLKKKILQAADLTLRSDDILNKKLRIQ